MIELASVSATIDANAQRIWDVLLDFGHPERLAPSIAGTTLTGEGPGAVRIVKSARGLEIHEQLVECEVAGGRFRYVVLASGEMPFPGITSYDCTITLAPLSNEQTRVVWRSEGEINGPAAPIRKFLSELYANAIGHISVHVAG